MEAFFELAGIALVVLAAFTGEALVQWAKSRNNPPPPARAPNGRFVKRVT